MLYSNFIGHLEDLKRYCIKNDLPWSFLQALNQYLILMEAEYDKEGH